MIGIIDWRDAMVTDPFYELVALHLGSFGVDRRQMGRFLAGDDWQVDEGFADHAPQVTLMHRFDCLRSVIQSVQTAGSLAYLAKEIWTPID